ncbi:MAG: hypothetical protein ACI8RU_001269 [Zhongshania aliphaticivorans]|jgi:hypothetical protein
MIEFDAERNVLRVLDESVFERPVAIYAGGHQEAMGHDAP